MTNKERYQRAFSTLHASNNSVTEVNMMKFAGKKKINKLLAACAVFVLVLGMTSMAYAADVGHIQRNIQLWIHGDQTNVVMEIEDGAYSYTYTDEDGQLQHRSGGGMVSGPDGQLRPATEAEIMEHLSQPEVVWKEDGTVWVYCQDQKIEITDQFDEHGVCYVQDKDSKGTLFMTIKSDSGYSTSRNSYPNPRSFN